MKVVFIYKNGRQRSMERQQALILQQLGHGQLSTGQTAEALHGAPSRRRAAATPKTQRGQA